MGLPILDVRMCLSAVQGVSKPGGRQGREGGDIIRERAGQGGRADQTSGRERDGK